MLNAWYSVCSSSPGPEFWDVGVLTFLRLDHQPLITKLHLKNLPLNECFLVFGSFGLLFNILGSYKNVYKATAKKGESVITPIFGLLPFVINAGLNVWWLAGNDFIRTQHLLPFAVFWGEWHGTFPQNSITLTE
jgi:ethanolaminephosphotransferase